MLFIFLYIENFVFLQQNKIDMRLRNAKIVGDFHINRLRFVPRISSHIKSYSWLRHVSMKVLSERAQVTTAEKHG